MIAPAHSSSKPNSFEVRILRQDAPGEPSHWERHRIAYEPEMNVISVLQQIAAQATTVDGKATSPRWPGTATAWKRSAAPARCSSTADAAGLLGPGRPAAGRRSRRDRAAADEQVPRAARPVRRPLAAVPRARKGQGWIAVDGYYDLGAGPRESQDEQERRYPLQRVHELRLLPGGLPAVPQDRGRAAATAKPTRQFEARQNAAYDRRLRRRRTRSARRCSSTTIPPAR